MVIVSAYAASWNFLTPSEENLRRVRIASSDVAHLAQKLEGAGFDVLHSRPGDRLVQVVVSAAELGRLRERGLPVEVAGAGRPFREIQAERSAGRGGTPAGYPDLATVEQAMADLAAAYPTLCTVVDVTSTYGADPTFEGRNLRVLRISDNVTIDEDEPAVLIVSAHHCREIVTPVIALEAATRLLTEYGSDPRVTAAVDGNEIWIAPVWNPDGYVHVFEVDNLWRKNRRIFDDGIGVDTNRNYPVGWETACGGSNTTTSNTYKGPEPASEPETRTMLTWSHDRRFAKVLDYHSSGREALYTYSCLEYPFESYLAEEAAVLSTESGYGGSIRLPSAEGEHYQTQYATYGSYSFLVETQEEFQPPFEDALSEAALVWPGILWTLERPIPLWGHVTDASNGAPLEATLRLLDAGKAASAPRDLTFTNGETNSSGGAFGRYHAFLPTGSYRIEFSAPGYAPEERIVRVSKEESLTLDIALEPARIAFDFPSGRPGRIDPGGDSFLLEIQETVPGGLATGTERLHFRTGSGPFTSVPLELVSPGSYRASFPPLDCPGAVEYFVTATDSAGSVLRSPQGAPRFASYRAALTTSRVVTFEDDFETDRGWQTEVLGASDGAWERGIPVNDPSWAHDPLEDADPGENGSCFLTANQTGNTDVDNGSVRLTSPPFDLGPDSASIRYRYFLRLTNTSNADDRLLVEIRSFASPDGQWTPIALHTTDGNLYWRTHTITQDDLDAAGVPASRSVRLRFTATDAGNPSIVEAGIDSLRVSVDSCRP